MPAVHACVPCVRPAQEEALEKAEGRIADGVHGAILVVCEVDDDEEEESAQAAAMHHDREMVRQKFAISLGVDQERVRVEMVGFEKEEVGEKVQRPDETF